MYRIASHSCYTILIQAVISHRRFSKCWNVDTYVSSNGCGCGPAREEAVPGSILVGRAAGAGGRTLELELVEANNGRGWLGVGVQVGGLPKV